MKEGELINEKRGDGTSEVIEMMEGT